VHIDFLVAICSWSLDCTHLFLMQLLRMCGDFCQFPLGHVHIDGVRLRLWTTTTNRPIAHTQIIYEYVEPWWNDIDRGQPKNSEKIWHSATLLTTNATWTDPGANPGLYTERSASNRLNRGGLPFRPYLFAKIIHTFLRCWLGDTECNFVLWSRK
jgi:hypothetical protein